jgi:tetratricopeptide (TPR) repeat protein
MPVASRRELQEWLRNDKELLLASVPEQTAPDDSSGTEQDASFARDPTVIEVERTEVRSERVAPPPPILGRSLWPAFAALGVLAVAVLLPVVGQSSPPEPLEGEVLRLYSEACEASKRGEEMNPRIIDLMNRALELHPGQPDLLSMRGYAFRATGQYRRAIEDLNASIRRKPDFSFDWYNRGIAWAKLGDYRKGIADFTRAIHLLPDDRRSNLFYHERGIAYLKLAGERRYRPYMEQALQDFNKASQLNPKNGWAYHERGALYMKLEEPFKALAEYNKAAEILPPEDRHWLYIDRAWVKQKLGDFAGAAADRERAQAVTAKR